MGDFLFFGVEPMKNLKAGVPWKNTQSLSNGILKQANLHEYWDNGQYRLDYVARSGNWIEFRFKIVVPAGDWAGGHTMRNANPSSLLLMPYGLLVRHNDQFRISTNDPVKLPVPTRIVVETRSPYQYIWDAADLFLKAFKERTSMMNYRRRIRSIKPPLGRPSPWSRLS